MNNFTDDKTVFLLDSYGLIFREYYAFFSHPLTDSKGRNLSAVFGFFRNLSLILKNFKPKYFIAAMDSRTPTFRHEQFKEYKATRAKTPEDLKAQFPVIEELLNILKIPVVRMDGYEADDVIATIARKCDRESRHCLILSADKDLQQLANANIHMLKPDKIKTWAEVDEQGVADEWGVSPGQLLDLLSLTGDSADNVPGVPGVGPKSAVKLISEYGSLENIYASADLIKGALGEKIRTNKDNAFLSKKLITLCENVPLEALNDGFEAYNIEKLDFDAFAKEMITRELPALAKTYSSFTDGGSLPPAPDAASSASPSSGENPATPPEPLTLVPNHGNYRACTDLNELKSFIDAAVKAGTAAFDTETDSLDTFTANLAGFSLAYEKGTAIYVPLMTNEDPLFAPPLIPKKQALEELKRLFSSKTRIIMHNAKFDIKVLHTNGLEVHIENLCDTMIASWLCEPDKTGRSPYSLETLAEQKLGLRGTEFEEIVGKNQTFLDVKIDEAAAYAAEDADFTLQLWQHYEKVLTDSGLLKLYTDTEMKVLPVLADMELEGIHLDSSVLRKYEGELKAQLAAAEKAIHEAVGHDFNIASPKQLSQVLFEERGLKPGKKTKTGYSTDTDVLESLRPYDPVPGMILDYRAGAKLLSTYVQTLPELTDENGRIHTTFMQTGTATGRLSSKDPNLQNIPVRSEEGRRIRSAFTAPEGSILISADYAQIELVVLAHLSGDKNLCDAFNAGTDVHRTTASLIYGVSPENVTAEMRRSAKTLNFGLMYGMSAFRLANELKISRTQAADFIDNYFRIYSGVKSFFDRNIDMAVQNGYIETISGRKRYIPAINSSNKMEKEGAVRIAKNSPIQGSAADIVKKAMIDVSEALKANPTGARMLLQVHDELILECPDNPDAVSATIALITDKMEHAVKLNVPLKVSVESGRCWGEFH